MTAFGATLGNPSSPVVFVLPHFHMMFSFPGYSLVESFPLRAVRSGDSKFAVAETAL